MNPRTMPASRAAPFLVAANECQTPDAGFTLLS
jgi:hypothetical protein